MEEDPTVRNYEFLDNSFTPLKHTNVLKLHEALENPSTDIYLRLDDTIFGFIGPTVSAVKEAEKFPKVSHFSDLNSPAMIASIQKAIETVMSGKGSAKPANKAVSYEEMCLVEKQIFRWNQKKTQLFVLIDELEKTKTKLDKKANARINMMFGTMFLMAFTEFCIGYHCIYNISWLGWDLVEPVTYTIAQGKFVIGVWFFCKYLSDTSCTNLSSFFTNRFRHRMYKKHRFENERLEHLKEMVKEIDNQIYTLEKAHLY